MAGEFELIDRYLKPLARGHAGAFNLTDDAAAIDVPAGRQLVVTKDALIAGVHFPSDARPEDAATKALRVNLSDLAAMGAKPIGYLLALILPRAGVAQWLARFAAALAVEQTRFDVHLVGGDMTATDGPLTITVTALGEVESNRMLRRKGAKVGDELYVSGTIGDAALALEIMAGNISASEPDTAWLMARYHRPEPRLALGQALVGLATSAVDISDGLVADVGHICAASGVGSEIEIDKVPLSPIAGSLCAGRPEIEDLVLAGGDDYELAFTVAPRDADLLATVRAQHGAMFTRIGHMVAGQSVKARAKTGKFICVESNGYDHFLT